MFHIVRAHGPLHYVCVVPYSPVNVQHHVHYILRNGQVWSMFHITCCPGEH